MRKGFLGASGDTINRVADLIDVGVPSDLTEDEAKALTLYLKHFNYSEVSRQMGLTIANARKVVLRAVDLRAMELLKEADVLILAQVTTLLRDLSLLEPLIDRQDGLAMDLDALDYQLKIWDRLSRLLGLDRPVKTIQFQAKLTKEELAELRDARWAALGRDANGFDKLLLALEEAPESTQVIQGSFIEVPEPPKVAPAPVALDSGADEPEGWVPPGERDPEEDAPTVQERYGAQKPKQYRAPAGPRAMSG